MSASLFEKVMAKDGVAIYGPGLEEVLITSVHILLAGTQAHGLT